MSNVAGGAPNRNQFGTPNTTYQPDDLAGGQVTTVPDVTANQFIADWHQRLNHRDKVLNWVGWFVFSMTLLFGVFVALIADKLATSETVDWHILALGTACILPPTIALIGLGRMLFANPDRIRKESMDDASDNYPSLGFIKEVVSLVAEMRK